MESKLPVAAEPSPSLGRLFLSFLAISLSGIGGGVITAIWHEAVLRRKWMDQQKFTAGLSLCQVVPGPNAVNLAVFVGTTMRGAAGAVSAFAGLIVLPAILIFLLGLLYASIQHGQAIQGALAGMGAAAIGMNFGLGTRMVVALKFEWRPMLMIAAVIIAVGVLRFPLVAALLVLGLVNFLLILATDRVWHK